MSRNPYKTYETVYPCFMSSSFVEGFPLFADPDAARIVLNSLKFLQIERHVTRAMQQGWHKRRLAPLEGFFNVWIQTSKNRYEFIPAHLVCSCLLRGIKIPRY